MSVSSSCQFDHKIAPQCFVVLKFKLVFNGLCSATPFKFHDLRNFHGGKVKSPWDIVDKLNEI